MTTLPPPLSPSAFRDPDFVVTPRLGYAHVAFGPPDGPLALFVHGFPDHPMTWRHQLPVLAGLGYRAVAVWPRGFAPTQVPAERTVGLDVLVDDVDDLHSALGGDERAVLVAHDWGAVAGWRAVARSPQRWSRLVALAIPPLTVLQSVWREPRQLSRLWYQLAFQVPGAESVLGPTAVRRLWRLWSGGREPSPAHLAAISRMLASPGCARAVLSYYRGLVGELLGGRLLGGDEPLPTCPVLYLHGRDDGCFHHRYAQRTDGLLAPGSRVEVLAGAGHFVHLDAADEVSRAVGEFVAGQ